MNGDPLSRSRSIISCDSLLFLLCILHITVGKAIALTEHVSEKFELDGMTSGVAFNKRGISKIDTLIFKVNKFILILLFFLLYAVMKISNNLSSCCWVLLGTLLSGLIDTS